MPSPAPVAPLRSVNRAEIPFRSHLRFRIGIPGIRDDGRVAPSVPYMAVPFLKAPFVMQSLYEELQFSEARLDRKLLRREKSESRPHLVPEEFPGNLHL